MKRNGLRAIKAIGILLSITIVLTAMLNTRTGVVSADSPTAISTSSPISIVPGFDQIVLLKTSWTDAQVILRAQGYRVSGPSILINDAANDFGSARDPQFVAGVGLNGDQIQQVGFSVRPAIIPPPIDRPYIDGLAWKLVDPTRLITEFGPPVDIEFGLASATAGYYTGYTLYWNNPSFAVDYELIIQPQDIKGDRFRICLRNDRLIGASLVYSASFSDLYTRFPTVFRFRSDMLIGVPTVTDLAPILQRGDCTETYVSSWITLSEGRPTWTPFPDYTDTPTPAPTTTATPR